MTTVGCFFTSIFIVVSRLANSGYGTHVGGKWYSTLFAVAVLIFARPPALGSHAFPSGSSSNFVLLPKYNEAEELAVMLVGPQLLTAWRIQCAGKSEMFSTARDAKWTGRC